ncbi:MAG: hypothetical protein K9L66_05150 [Spirochaetaceae bacterium]|nr:hypothetical protein [Spirochaetaceae bacterium]MCF7951040.1 hypothetical protein [Spirochaetaceae bacterium]
MQWDQANKNWILDDSQSNLDAFLEKLHHTGLFSLADSIGLSRSGAVHCVSALRHFFRINYPHRYPNPADSIPVPRQSKKYPDILSKEEVFELLGSLSTIKHRFLLSLAYSYEEAKSFVLR